MAADQATDVASVARPVTWHPSPAARTFRCVVLPKAAPPSARGGASNIAMCPVGRPEWAAFQRRQLDPSSCVLGDLNPAGAAVQIFNKQNPNGSFANVNTHTTSACLPRPHGRSAAFPRSACLCVSGRRSRVLESAAICRARPGMHDRGRGTAHEGRAKGGEGQQNSC